MTPEQSKGQQDYPEAQETLVPEPSIHDLYRKGKLKLKRVNGKANQQEILSEPDKRI